MIQIPNLIQITEATEIVVASLRIQQKAINPRIFSIINKAIQIETILPFHIKSMN